jgi:hypothetical protein
MVGGNGRKCGVSPNAAVLASGAISRGARERGRTNRAFVHRDPEEGEDRARRAALCVVKLFLSSVVVYSCVRVSVVLSVPIGVCCSLCGQSVWTESPDTDQNNRATAQGGRNKKRGEHNKPHKRGRAVLPGAGVAGHAAAIAGVLAARKQRQNRGRRASEAEKVGDEMGWWINHRASKCHTSVCTQCSARERRSERMAAQLAALLHDGPALGSRCVDRAGSPDGRGGR